MSDSAESGKSAESIGMKLLLASERLSFFFLAVSVVLPLSFAQELADEKRVKPAMTEPVSAEELTNRLRHSRQNDPIRKLAPPANPGVDPSKGTHGRDLIAESTVLNHAGVMTLVPKRAVLHLPEALKSRVGIRDGSELLPWAKFLERNRSWIHAEPVSRERALGKMRFSPEETQALRSSGKVSIATYEGGPISVLPAAFPAESGESSERAGESPLRKTPSPAGIRVVPQP